MCQAREFAQVGLKVTKHFWKLLLYKKKGIHLPGLEQNATHGHNG